MLFSQHLPPRCRRQRTSSAGKKISSAGNDRLHAGLRGVRKYLPCWFTTGRCSRYARSFARRFLRTQCRGRITYALPGRQNSSSTETTMVPNEMKGDINSTAGREDKSTNSRHIPPLYRTSAFVVVFHRNLLKGGIYLYCKTPKPPDGKLRLLRGLTGLAFTAGFRAVKRAMAKRILDINPELHQRRFRFFHQRPCIP